MKSCKTCKWWDHEKARGERGRLIRERVAPCLYPLEDVKLPASCSLSTTNLYLKYMTHYYGEDCKTYEKRRDSK